jgi:hypothetical protein
MFNQVRRFGLLAALLTLLLTALAACGGTAGASPDARVQGYINDMNSAFADKDLATEAKQEEWADKLSKYFIPADQAAQKTQIKEGLAQFSSMPGMSVKIENVKLEKVSESGDNAEVKFVDGTVIMDIAGQKNEQKLSETGLVSEGGAPTDLVKLQKIDGVWYMVSGAK